MQKHPRLLLVDDERTSAMVQSFVLQQHGYSVDVAESGERALELCGDSMPFNLILMDIRLGAGIDGIETARRILSLHEVPIVFLTSHAETAMVERAQTVFGYGYVLKSSGNAALLAAVSGALRLFEAHRSLQGREAVIRESELRYRTLFEEALDAIFVADAETGIITDCNPAAEQLVGLPRTELIGKPQAILHPPQDVDKQRGLSRTFVEHAQSDRPHTIETSVVTGSGELRRVAIKARRLEIGGRQIMHGVFRDVTEYYLQMDALRKALEENTLLLNELQHRVKNSLMIIGGVVALEELQANHPAARTSLERVRGRIDTITNLYTLLHASEHSSVVNLGTYVERVARSVLRAYRELDSADIEIAGDAPTIETQTAASVGLIVNELLTNACKHAADHGGVRSIHVRLKVSGSAPHSATIEIANQGNPLPAAFDPARDGNLGMHIVRTLVDQIAGTLSVDTGPPIRFSVSFPIDGR